MGLSIKEAEAIMSPDEIKRHVKFRIDYVDDLYNNYPHEYFKQKKQLTESSRFHTPEIEEVASNFPDSDWD